MIIETVKQASHGGYIVNGFNNVPNDPANSDYQAIQLWIASGNVVEPEFTDEELLRNEKARLKILLKSKRDLANLKPYVGGIANLIVNNTVTDTLVNFEFDTTPTGQPLTEPANILYTVLISGIVNPSFYIPYSCILVESREKAIVQLTIDIAQSITAHLVRRSAVNVQYADGLNDAIDAAETLEELNSLNIPDAFNN